MWRSWFAGQMHVPLSLRNLLFLLGFPRKLLSLFSEQEKRVCLQCWYLFTKLHGVRSLEVMILRKTAATVFFLNKLHNTNFVISECRRVPTTWWYGFCVTNLGSSSYLRLTKSQCSYLWIAGSSFLLQIAEDNYFDLVPYGRTGRNMQIEIILGILLPLCCHMKPFSKILCRHTAAYQAENTK